VDQGLPEHDADAVLRLARSALGKEAVATAWAEGSALSLEAALDEALAEDDRVEYLDAASGAGAAVKPNRAGPRYTDELTLREQQVAELVGRGCSNRQIAEQLVITEGTAKVHMGRVLAKLGLHSRTQLAAWAVRHTSLVCNLEG
jgi:DNA-binding NarL/FixJ family response regulator